MNDGRIELRLPCSCSSHDHQAWITYWSDDEVAYLTVHLSHGRTFWQRMRTAIRYVLGLEVCRYGDWPEMLLDADEARKAIVVLQAFVDGQRR